MPELPEVETVCRGLKSAILKQRIVGVTIRNPNLRYPIPKNLPRVLLQQKILKIERRGKYILLGTKNGTLILHLGMSGNLQIKPKNHAVEKHEHFTVIFSNGFSMCYNDPRRFGAILWADKNPLNHKVLKDLGPEPFAKNFTASYLVQKAQGKKCAVKQFIMDSSVVTGIGNIYASEILFAAKIHPEQKVSKVTLKEFKKTVDKTKKILRLAIKHRGTTIRDHTDSQGYKGSFQDKLKVYGRQNKKCYSCNTKLIKVSIGQRATVFCPKCQIKSD